MKIQLTLKTRLHWHHGAAQIDTASYLDGQILRERWYERYVTLEAGFIRFCIAAQAEAGLFVC